MLGIDFVRNDFRGFGSKNLDLESIEIDFDDFR